MPRPLVILIVLLTLLIGVVFYPGLMSPDSATSWGEALLGRYGDLHPPVMAAMWSVFLRFNDGPAPMLALQLLMYAVGVALVAARLRSWRRYALPVALFLLPPFISTLGTVIKDIQMMGALILAFALCTEAVRRNCLALYLASIPPLIYALLLRHNALAIVAPLVPLWLSAACPRLATKWRLMVATPIVVGALGVGSMVATYLLTTRHQHPHQTVALFELVGISTRTGINMVPPEVLSTGLIPRELYNPICIWSIYWTDSCPPHVLPPSFQCYSPPPAPKVRPRFAIYEDARRVQAIYQSWSSAVKEFPIAALAHRIELWLALIGIGVEHTCYPYLDSDGSEPIGEISAKVCQSDFRWTVNRLLTWSAYLTRDSLLFKGWCYLLLGFLTLFILRSTAYRLLVLSGICYTASFLLVATTCEFRFMLWGALTSIIGALAAWDERAA